MSRSLHPLCQVRTIIIFKDEKLNSMKRNLCNFFENNLSLSYFPARYLTLPLLPNCRTPLCALQDNYPSLGVFTTYRPGF